MDTIQMNAICFDVDDLPLLVKKFSEAPMEEVSPEAFKIFESYCSGSLLAGGFDAARQWAKDHLQELADEANYWLNETSDHPDAGIYHLPMGYCRFVATGDFVLYETTSGTLLAVDGDNKFYVHVPQHQHGGFHSSILKALKEGATESDIERKVNRY